MTLIQHPYRHRTAMALVVSMVVIGGVLTQSTQSQATVSGGRSGMITADKLVQMAVIGQAARPAALMGIYVSKYLSETYTSPVQGALHGIQILNSLLLGQSNVGDPDFELLQAFADVLQVDVSDMLNRSVHRQEALDTYVNALTNVAARANIRFKDLTASLETLRDDTRQKNRERSDADRRLQDAIKDKNFTLASEIQKELTQKEEAYATANLKQQQVESVLDTLDQLLTLFGNRILAIQRNREALIAGTTVVDMPGVEDLKIISKGQTVRRRDNESFDEVFEQLNMQTTATGSQN